MAFDTSRLMLPIRIVQGVLAIIILGLLAYTADSWWWSSPSQVNFVIFSSIWTILAVIYLWLAPLKFPKAAHKYGILAAEAITMLFWFAGFIALAVLLTDVGCKRGGACSASIAGDVFAAFEWLLFTGTTIMAALHVYRTRNTHNPKHDPAMEVRPAAYEGA